MLYSMLKRNYLLFTQFEMTRIQMTVALSQLQDDFSDTLEALKQFKDTNGKFNESTLQLLNQLIQVVKDQCEMQLITEKDPELKGDLYVKIINGYSKTPDLRVAVLEQLAQYHISRNYFQEAAICYFHCSAIIGEYLTHFNLHYDHTKFLKTCPSVAEEHPICDQHALETDQVGQSAQFCERGLIKYLTEATHCMQKSQFYEILPEGYKLIIPLYEQQLNYTGLSQLYKNMADSYDALIKIEATHSRVFDTFYRIAFFGSGFKKLDGQQFVYKERLITQLSEICERMKLTFADLNPELIQDSRPVDVKSLKPGHYIQISNVKPHKIGSQFDKNFKIDKFIFSTPFTKNGKAHGTVDTQCLRKFIVHTEKPFPYLTKRIKISKIEDFELSPIEVSIDNLEERLVDMRLVLCRNPPDIKELQRVLSGSVRVTVNSGPLEVCRVFFSQRQQFPVDKIQQLEKIFREFLKLSDEALTLNKKLIKADQIEFQEDLEQGFEELKKQILILMK
eukprot:NODE_390_length_8164_cov_0.195908.p2 type:complete len:506 gc:universal NODE_390_length_8164_cov_0.195908:5371-6888(+)